MMMRSMRNARWARLGLYLALCGQVGLAASCRQQGSVGAGQGSAGALAASSHSPDVTLGTIAYQVVKGQVEQSTDNPQGKLQVLAQRRDDFVHAVDTIVPPAVASNLHGTLADLSRLVRDRTLPDLAENLARILELFANDPQDPQNHRLQAAVALSSAHAPLDRHSAVRLAGRLLAYPELPALLQSTAAFVRGIDGLDAQGQPTGFERDLLRELLGVVSRGLAGLERPQPQGASQGQSAFVDTLLQPIQLRGTVVGGPAWSVRIDKNGNPKVARRSDGRIHFPFLDADRDHVADVDADGFPVDRTGQRIDIPAFGQSGARDAEGRALAGTGDLLYEYFDAKATPLGQAMRLAGDLAKEDVPFAMLRAVDRMAPRTSRIDAQTGESYQAYADDNPALDVAWAGLEVFRYRDAPKLLDAFAALIRNDPRKAEQLMVKLVEAANILRSTPSAAAPAGPASSMLDDLQPLLDRAFEVNSRTGQSAARMMLLTFSQEQARLRNLPAGLARMMKYSDWMNRVLVQPGQTSEFEHLLDMMQEADQCDVWPFGNMAEFYLKVMAGEERILGIRLTVNTVNLIMDIGFLRSLLCSQISEQNVRALHAFAQSGSLDALIPITKAFVQAGEVTTLKDIFLALQASYATGMRPHEPGIVRLLESGAVEVLFEVFDDMNQVRVPGTNEIVSYVVADFLEALVDDDRTVQDRRAQRHRTLLHLLVDPLERLSQRMGSDPAFDRALQQSFDIALETTVDAQGKTVLRNHGLIPLTAAALEAASDGMSAFPWIRSREITGYQQAVTDLLTGRSLPVLVDLVLAIDRSPEGAVLKRSMVNVLRPNPQARHDIYGSVLEVLSAVLQAKTDPAAMVDLARFLGRALDPARGFSKPIVLGFVKLTDGPGGPTVVAILRNAVDLGSGGNLPAPIETVLDIVDAIAAQSLVPATVPTPGSVRQAALDMVEFIRDDVTGLQKLFHNLANSR